MSFIPFFIYLFIKNSNFSVFNIKLGSCCYALHPHTSKLGP